MNASARLLPCKRIKLPTDARNGQDVMVDDNHYAAEIERLHRTAAETRLRAVESQLALAFTLCKIAETEIRYDRPDEAIKVLNKVRNHAETISFHIDERDHLPSTAIPNLRKQLTQLTKRIEEIESLSSQR